MTTTLLILRQRACRSGRHADGLRARRSFGAQAPQFGAVPAGGFQVGLHRAGGDLAGHAGPLDGGRNPAARAPGGGPRSPPDQGGRSHDRAGLDQGPVQDDRAGADQAPVLDHAAFQVGVVTDHAFTADERRPLLGEWITVPSWIEVRRRSPSAVVAAQHRARPHRCLRADAHPADDDGVGMDEGGLVNVRLGLAQGVDRHQQTLPRGGYSRPHGRGIGFEGDLEPTRTTRACVSPRQHSMRPPRAGAISWTATSPACRSAAGGCVKAGLPMSPCPRSGSWPPTWPKRAGRTRS